MGTWGTGVFENDHSLDYIIGVTDRLMGTVDKFLQAPFIDDGFDEALTAIAILNEVMTRTGHRLCEQGGATRDPAPIAAAFLECFDQQASGLVGDSAYLQEWRSVVSAELDRFGELLSDT